MSAPHPRVAITGLGVVSAWGWGVEPFRAALEHGATAIRPISRLSVAGYPGGLGGEVPAPPVEWRRRIRDWSRLSWSDRFAVAAALEAQEAAGLPLDLSACDAGVYFGSSTGGMFEGERFYEQWRRRCLETAPRRLLAAQPVSRPGEAVGRAA